ncbi:hypothetical protein GCM10022232_66320 [Streptomyces plumbiresistens]|uniref:Transposase IS200-like domain-containing protein n=1 Tax=Streptomyces plumbiresistens TaxID=511811 RepID=A0ABP7SP44_9ACTN
MRSVCADFECELVEFNGETNHVRLLVNFPPKVAVTKLVNSLKGVSSRRLRQEFPTWYAATGGPTSCGRVPTSPAPSAAPRSPWSGSTSNSRTGPSEHRRLRRDSPRDVPPHGARHRWWGSPIRVQFREELGHICKQGKLTAVDRAPDRNLT